MTLDVPTLIVQTSIFEVSMALLMLFYVRHRRVYPGFTRWTLSTFIVALVYLLLAARDRIPYHSSVFFVQGAVILAAVLRLDGLLRFTGQPALRPGAYVFPLLMSAVSFGMARAGWAMSARAILLALVVGGLGVATVRVALTVSGPGRSVYRAAAGLWSLQALGFVGRALSWNLSPVGDDLGDPGSQTFFFALVLLCEVGLTGLFLALNSFRLEQELTDSRGLHVKILENLQETMATIKVLRGLLAICPRCKKVRVASDRWEALEVYVSRNADVEFTHGVCQKCLHHHYGGYRPAESRLPPNPVPASPGPSGEPP